MPATYVKISRQEFEDWLFDLCPVFERLDNTAGVYTCPLSPHVAVKISSSIGSSDKVVARGAGACHMTFISRQTKHPLRPAPGESYRLTTHRTKGWKDNWRTALTARFDAFKKNRDHYNRLGKQTQAEYAQEWAKRIEGIRNYTDHKILRDCRDLVLAGKWLTPKQEAAIWKFVNPPRKVKRSNPKPVEPNMTDRDRDALIAALDKLEAAATTAKDSWTVSFASGSLRTRVGNGRAPTSRQAETLREKLRRYNVYIPKILAA